MESVATEVPYTKLVRLVTEAAKPSPYGLRPAAFVRVGRDSDLGTFSTILATAIGSPHFYTSRSRCLTPVEERLG